MVAKKVAVQNLKKKIIWLHPLQLHLVLQLSNILSLVIYFVQNLIEEEFTLLYETLKEPLKIAFKYMYMYKSKRKTI